jgi:sugar/nucleoside kinase (ribokinase family)
MITGFDISLDDLRMIRVKTSGLIYMDIHSLARGVAEGYARPLQMIDRAEEWLAPVNAVQCNEAEARMLFDEEDEQKLAYRVLACGPEVFIITKGDKGARVYYRHRGEIASVFVSAEPVAVTTEVGCGDVFGSAFFFHYSKTRDAVFSLKMAVSHSGLFVKTGFGL